MALAIPALHLPGPLLAKFLTDARYAVTLVNADDPANSRAVCAQIVQDDASDTVARIVTVQEWCFDRATFLPLRVKFRLPDNLNAAHYGEAVIEFTDYRLVGGSLFPFRMVTHEEGQLLAVARVTSVSLNEPISPLEFQSATGGSR